MHTRSWNANYLHKEDSSSLRRNSHSICNWFFFIQKSKTRKLQPKLCIRAPEMLIIYIKRRWRPLNWGGIHIQFVIDFFFSQKSKTWKLQPEICIHTPKMLIIFIKRTGGGLFIEKEFFSHLIRTSHQHDEIPHPQKIYTCFFP
jgi:hypothetical protein